MRIKKIVESCFKMSLRQRLRPSSKQYEMWSLPNKLVLDNNKQLKVSSLMGMIGIILGLIALRNDYQEFRSREVTSGILDSLEIHEREKFLRFPIDGLTISSSMFQKGTIWKKFVTLDLVEIKEANNDYVTLKPTNVGMKEQMEFYGY